MARAIGTQILLIATLVVQYALATEPGWFPYDRKLGKAVKAASSEIKSTTEFNKYFQSIRWPDDIDDFSGQQVASAYETWLGINRDAYDNLRRNTKEIIREKIAFIFDAHDVKNLWPFEQILRGVTEQNKNKLPLISKIYKENWLESLNSKAFSLQECNMANARTISIKTGLLDALPHSPSEHQLHTRIVASIFILEKVMSNSEPLMGIYWELQSYVSEWSLPFDAVHTYDFNRHDFNEATELLLQTPQSEQHGTRYEIMSLINILDINAPINKLVNRAVLKDDWGMLLSTYLLQWKSVIDLWNDVQFESRGCLGPANILYNLWYGARDEEPHINDKHIFALMLILLLDMSWQSEFSTSVSAASCAQMGPSLLLSSNKTTTTFWNVLLYICVLVGGIMGCFVDIRAVYFYTKQPDPRQAGMQGGVEGQGGAVEEDGTEFARRLRPAEA